MSGVEERVARAAIAKLFLRDPNIIEAQAIEGGMVRASYQFDGHEHAYHMRVEGNRVIWRVANIPPSGQPGRWRDHPLDDRTTFRIDGDEVVVTVAESAP